MPTLAFIPNLGPQEMVILLIIALLLFGKRLPEVGRSLGRGIVEFKRGVKGITDEIEQESERSTGSTAGTDKTWQSIEPSKLDAPPPANTVGQGERPAEEPMPDQPQPEQRGT